MFSYILFMIRKNVNINNIRHNIIKLKSVNNAKFCAVVKANAYGHGIEICQDIQDLVDFFAVATVQEALNIKKLKIKNNILLLSKFNYGDLESLIKNHIRLTVDNLDDVAHIISTAMSLHKKVYVHIKINTGMNRLGVKTKKEFLEIYNTLKSCNLIKIEGIYTHFATAENKNSYKLKRQNAKFLSIINTLPKKVLNKIIIHASNSSGFLKSSKYAYDMVRVGIAMYGYDQTNKLELKPALNIQAKIVNVIDIQEGETVGYGGEFVAKSDMKIAVVAMGYADGFIRAYKDGYVIFEGQRCKIVGRICMDMFMIDVTHLFNHSQSNIDEKNKQNENKHNFMDDISGLFDNNTQSIFMSNDTIYKLFKSQNFLDESFIEMLPIEKIINSVVSYIKSNIDNLENDKENETKLHNNNEIIGKWVTILGQDGEEIITARELAKLSNTIEYEVLTNFNMIRY